MPESLKELCRTCLRSGGEMFSLFNADVKMLADGFPTIGTVMKMFTSTPFNNTDDFSYHICAFCLNEIQRAYMFKEKCEKSEKILHQLKAFKIKVKKLKNICNRNENNGENNDCEFHNDIKKESDEIVIEHEDHISGNIGIENELNLQRISPTTQFDNIDHTSSTFKNEPELIIDDSSIRLNDGDKTKEDEEEFNCPACGRESQSLVMYLNHIIADHIEVNLCRICKEEFNCTPFEHLSKHPPSNYSVKLFHDLKSHFLEKRTQKYGELNAEEDKESVVCAKTICENNTNDKFNAAELIDEENFQRNHSSESGMETKQTVTISDELKFQCEFCCRSFRRKWNLEQHLAIHTSKRLFECKLCLEKFRARLLLRYHIKTKHQSALLPDNTVTDERPYECKLCLGKFQSKSTLGTHLRELHSKVPTSLKSKNQCRVCSTTFHRSSCLRIHMRTHTGETPFQCELCSQTFRRKEMYRSHMIRKHTEKSPNDKPKYQCCVCSKTFGYNNHLTNHMRTHNSDKSFECKLCSLKFWYSSSLISHMKTKHTEELPGDEPKYICHCSHIFNSNEQLMQHIVEHTDKKLIESENLQLMMTHTETEQPNESSIFRAMYKCGHCSQMFVNNRFLINHMASHSDEPPCKCDLCLKTFSINQFRYHMRTVHSQEVTGDKAKYQCNICLRNFGYNKELNRHMLSHTGEKH